MDRVERLRGVGPEGGIEAASVEPGLEKRARGGPSAASRRGITSARGLPLAPAPGVRRVVVDGDLAAAPQECVGCARAGDACADDRDALRACAARGRARGESALRGVPSCGHGRATLATREAGGLQIAADIAGDGVGGRARARRAEARDMAQRFGRPHVGVLRRRKAVEEPGIDARARLR